MAKFVIALAGNPNCGKTSIFNEITGARQHVGNWPGVTVEKVTGERTHAGVKLEVIDLPGTYSLTAYSLDEIVARDFIIDERPDVVLQIVDSTNLERNLYLTTQLMELGVKVVMALNMSDLADERGLVLDATKIEEFLEVPVVRTVGRTGEGIDKLLDVVVKEAQKGPHHEHEVGYGDEVESAIIRLENIIEKDVDLSARYPVRWLAVKLLEGDEKVLEKVTDSTVADAIEKELASTDTEEFEALIADKRYEAIGAILPQVCTACVERISPSEMVDRVLTNKYLGIPIFLALMYGAFELTFTAATPFMDLIDGFFGWLAGTVAANVGNPFLASLLGDGIIAGVGFVLIFVPNIFILFFVLAYLEDSGYLARAAFIMDKLMYSIGLHGKSFIPMLMGFGCSTPAIMATRTIEDRNDRLITILVTPFMSCGARLPVYVMLAGAFFSARAGSIIWGLYVLGIIVAIVSAKLLRTFVLPGRPAPFIMELPSYRRPTLRTGLLHMWQKGSIYLRRAGTFILMGAMVVWLMAAFPAGVEYGSEASYAGQFGKLLEPLVKPLGFDWKIAVALFFGFLAKEVVIGSMGVLYGAGENEVLLSSALQSDPAFSPLVALCLMVFTLIYMPCVAALGMTKKETGSWGWTAFAATFSTGLAWIMTFLVYRLGLAIGI